MSARRLLVPLAIVASLASCSADTDSDQIDPDPAGGVIDQEVDEDTVITDPGGFTNNLDGNDGDIEDRQGDGEENP